LLGGAKFLLGQKKPEAKTAKAISTRPSVPAISKPLEVPAQTRPVIGNDSNATPTLSQIYAVRTYIDPLKNEINELKAQMSKSEKPKKRFKDPLEEEVQKLREELKDFIQEKKFETADIPACFRRLTNFWKEKGVSEKQVNQMILQMEEWNKPLSSESPENEVIQALNQILMGSIREANVFGRDERRIVVLVGPTGVGKTTTIAKMAAYEKLKLKRSVAMITVDDYKIGGTDQLAHYARILEVPFLKSRSDMTLEDQCRLQSAKTIYVDTFGLSSRDEERLATLKEMLNFKDPRLAAAVEVHLVLPVGVSTGDLKMIMDFYSQLNPKFLAFTKWDETENWGGMLSAILMSKKPVSFISYGQNVPDDFALFSREKFIETVTAVTGE